MRLAIGLGIVFAAALAAQEEIHVDVRLVQLTFTVRGADGQLVSNLSAGDFEVLEDGLPQRVARFTRGEDLPLRLGLLVDGSGSQSDFVRQHRRHLRSFLDEALGPEDQAFVLGFGNWLRLISDFSNDEQAMLQALSDYPKKAGRFPTLGPDVKRSGGTAFFDAIYHSIRERLANVDRGRRALVIFSDGADNSSGHHMLDALEEAQYADVRLFGLWYAGGADGAHKVKVRDLYGLRVMERLAADTGGQHYRASGAELEEQFRRIAEDLRSSYEVAYYSSNPAPDGAFRGVRVRARDEGLAVRHKAGYYAR